MGNKYIEDIGSILSIGENDLKFIKNFGIENYRENISWERLVVESLISLYMKMCS